MILKSAFVGISAAVVVAGAASVCLAAPAQAFVLPDIPAQVWVQSFQRSGPDAPCVAPANETPWNSAWFAADQVWKPSWSLWPNNGNGGWTCNRAITWDPGVTYSLIN
jgi:hypothetical protein